MNGAHKLWDGPWATGFLGCYVAFLITPCTLLLMLRMGGVAPIPGVTAVHCLVADLMGFLLLAAHFKVVGAVRMARCFSILALLSLMGGCLRYVYGAVI